MDQQQGPKWSRAQDNVRYVLMLLKGDPGAPCRVHTEQLCYFVSGRCVTNTT